MKDLLIKWFMAFNVFIIRASGGRIGVKLGTQSVLLLHNIGRKSGRKLISPIAYFYVDGIYFVVASNWGKDVHPGWYFNLLAAPETHIEVNGRTLPVLAREAQADEYARLWKYAVEHHPPYLDYQKATARHIPIMVFTPQG